jgi:hypothetical protein
METWLNHITCNMISPTLAGGGQLLAYSETGQGERERERERERDF